ncbi:pseudaminic acid cytidylyltransferase [Uliginosibacterium aquaticum]|uniref:Pseudaminic acid cytidylyltransferase n=1 Tax=Uliginosibacterium aquaticum TaxID=2731212 RepID=A0ABX2IET9_9RHOO|nr:pseudaminic acid cytidylyltransferase [Uliginosibacterium aquaticum]NSL55169.1 pseudaminic acid cytidylyltransferase [Uliginosibacterium aquaticum]
MKLCVIPARGGSKRIPRKNLKDFCGRPIIGWSVVAARRAGCFDQIIVSTDDEEIAATARNLGASTPFMRPPELSDDHTGTTAVIAHAIRHFDAAGTPPTLVCCLYATAPFASADDLCAGLERLQDSDADYAFPVTRYPFPIQRAVRLDEAQHVRMFQPEHFATRSQDLEEAWHDAGQFYWGRREAWLAGTPIFSPRSLGLPVPRHRVQDIDTPEDWLRAEWLFKAMQAER